MVLLPSHTHAPWWREISPSALGGVGWSDWLEMGLRLMRTRALSARGAWSVMSEMTGRKGIAGPEGEKGDVCVLVCLLLSVFWRGKRRVSLQLSHLEVQSKSKPSQGKTFTRALWDSANSFQWVWIPKYSTMLKRLHKSARTVGIVLLQLHLTLIHILSETQMSCSTPSSLQTSPQTLLNVPNPKQSSPKKLREEGQQRRQRRAS